MDSVKGAIDGLPKALKIGAYVSGPVLLGVAGGLALWFVEDAVKDQIDDKPWLLPVIGGVAIGGLGAFILLK
jgi:hypothetical protein